MRVLELSTIDFIRLLLRAACDDRRYPQLESYNWLVAHAKIEDGQVQIIMPI